MAGDGEAKEGMMAGEEDVNMNVDASAYNLFRLFQQVFELSLPADAATSKPREELRSEVMQEVNKYAMAPLYEALIAKGLVPADAAALEKMKAENAAKLSAFDTATAEAREKFGDMEVYEQQKGKADYLVRIGDKEGALKAYDATGERSLSSGQKIDIMMGRARLVLQHGDWSAAKDRIAEAKELNEKGGDWDRRNRLKVYEAVQCLVVRDFKRAADLLLDSVSTFTAVELLEYKTLILYTVVSALLHVPRVQLKKRVVDSPDVLSAISDTPFLSDLLNSFYEARYRDFFVALVNIFPALRRDRYLSEHAQYYIREMRLAAYNQFLESYKSVTIAGMAASFGVSAAFLDAELSRLIAAGKITAKVDAVAGIVETSRPDNKNAQYLAVIKQGDLLLNKIQKLSRVITL